MEHRKSGNKMNPVENIFADMPDSQKDEQIEVILQVPGLRIERIVSSGQSSPDGFWYDQDDNEWVLLLKGSAGLRFEGREDILALKPGDHIRIDRHQKHRVEWTHPDQETVWLAVHFQ
jgi:cupin 2 domain-containing protein